MREDKKDLNKKKTKRFQTNKRKKKHLKVKNQYSIKLKQYK